MKKILIDSKQLDWLVNNRNIIYFNQEDIDFNLLNKIKGGIILPFKDIEQILLDLFLINKEKINENIQYYLSGIHYKQLIMIYHILINKVKNKPKPKIKLGKGEILIYQKEGKKFCRNYNKMISHLTLPFKTDLDRFKNLDCKIVVNQENKIVQFESEISLEQFLMNYKLTKIS